MRALFDAGMIPETTATLNLNYWPNRSEDADNTIIFGGIPSDLSLANYVDLEVKETFAVVPDSVQWTFKL